MDTPLLAFIKAELKVARTMLQLADTHMAAPRNPEAVAHAINHARTALEVTRRLLPQAHLPDAEHAAFEQTLADLERDLHEENASDENRK